MLYIQTSLYRRSPGCVETGIHFRCNCLVSTLLNCDFPPHTMARGVRIDACDVLDQQVVTAKRTRRGPKYILTKPKEPSRPVAPDARPIRPPRQKRTRTTTPSSPPPDPGREHEFCPPPMELHSGKMVRSEAISALLVIERNTSESKRLPAFLDGKTAGSLSPNSLRERGRRT